MRLDSLFYRLSYRYGSPRWDTGEPRAELKELVEGRPPGRALDLGCGTGTNAVFLAKQGWEVVGVDFVPEAVEAARKRALASGVSVSFVVGDVAQLRRTGVVGPFDLVVDVGCYHALPESLRDAYEAGVASVSGPGSDFYLSGISNPPATWRLLHAKGVDAAELHLRFDADFVLSDERPLGPIGRASHFVLYHLVRKPVVLADARGDSPGRAGLDSSG
jgi:SAM-dependent methyltransferase